MTESPDSVENPGLEVTASGNEIRLMSPVDVLSPNPENILF